MGTKQTIIFTGGGSGGHWFPLLSVLEAFQFQQEKTLDNKKGKDHKLNFIYIGSKFDLKNEFLRKSFDQSHTIPVGKLRRYLSWKNVTDLYQICIGIMKAIFILTNYKNRVIFSSGGYVSIPVVVAGFLLRTPIIVHEQTSRMGLANRIALNFCNVFCFSFKSNYEKYSKQFLNNSKLVFSGYPLRHAFYESKKPTFENTNLKEMFKSSLKKILICGGANGSKQINKYITSHLPELTKKYIVFHQMGIHQPLINTGNAFTHQNYYSFDKIFSNDWISLLKGIDLYIGRSGAGIVHELMFLEKRAIFIPLAIAQKNEQYYNAEEYRKQSKLVAIIQDKELDKMDLLTAIQEMMNRKMKNKKINKNIKTNESTNKNKVNPPQFIGNLLKNYL